MSDRGWRFWMALAALNAAACVTAILLTLWVESLLGVKP